MDLVQEAPNRGLLEQLEHVTNLLAQERQACEQLRTMSEMKDVFLQALSHDLRSPIAVILAFAELLHERNAALNDAQRKIAVTSLAASARVIEQKLQLLTDLDELSAAGHQLQREPIRLDEIVRDVAEHTDAEGRTMIVDAIPIVVEADQAKVRRIIECLVSNAVRHTPETSTIALRILKDDRDVTIEIEDDGPGMDNEPKARIFEPFSARSQNASGIGLTVVAGFASLHGGSVSVEDVRSGGARFRVRLPLREPS
ncbi:MAG: sensor histidine kinase [Actinomycetota bacterium]